MWLVATRSARDIYCVEYVAAVLACSLGILSQDSSQWEDRVHRLRYEYEERVSSKREFYEASVNKVKLAATSPAQTLASAKTQLKSP